MQRFCNNDVGWYTSVKETQGSVEVTSYVIMKNIFEYGCYRIGKKQADISNTVNEIVSLQLKEKDGKRFSKKTYNFSDLRDLESKLVLITGSNVDNKEEVDLFVKVCCIAIIMRSRG